MSVPETGRKAPARAAPANGHGDRLDQYRRLIESLTDYAIFSLSTSGFITSWNSGAQSTFGYDTQEALGHHYSLIFTDDDIASGRPERQLSAAIATGKESCDGWHVRKDGT